MPDWNQAPPWANYAAMDRNGCWYWYSTKPTIADGKVFWDCLDPIGRMGIIHPNPPEVAKWRESLQERP